MRARRTVAGLLLVLILPAPLGGRRGAARGDVPVPWDEPPGWDDPRPRLPYDAADLASDCNDDGMVEVTRDLEVRSGAATLARDCRILIADRALLSLHLVSLTGAQDLDIQAGAGAGLTLDESRIAAGGLIGFESGDRGRLEIRHSELSTLAGGTIHLSPGGRDSSAAIVSSVISSGGDLMVAASLYGSGGRAVVRGSNLSSGDGPLDSVAVYASLSGNEGQTEVRDSRLAGTERIEIVSGDLGRTTAILVTFQSAGPVLVAAGAGGRCESRDNTPPVDCARDE